LAKPIDCLEAIDVTEMVQPFGILVHTFSPACCTCSYFRQLIKGSYNILDGIYLIYQIKLANLSRQVEHTLIKRCRIFLDCRSIFTRKFAIEKKTAARAVLGHLKQFYKEERNNIQILVKRVTNTVTDDEKCVSVFLK